MVLTQFSFLFFLLFFSWKRQGSFSHFVTAGYQSISIHSTVMIAHVVQGPNLIGLRFQQCFISKKKLCLYGSDCQHTIVQLSLIRTSDNECIHMCQRLPDFTQNHPIPIRISLPAVFSHVPLVSPFLFSLPVPCQPLPLCLIKGRPALLLVEQKLCNVVPKSGWFISGTDWLAV